MDTRKSQRKAGPVKNDDIQQLIRQTSHTSISSSGTHASKLMPKPNIEATPLKSQSIIEHQSISDSQARPMPTNSNHRGKAEDSPTNTTEYMKFTKKHGVLDTVPEQLQKVKHHLKYNNQAMLIQHRYSLT